MALNVGVHAAAAARRRDANLPGAALRFMHKCRRDAAALIGVHVRDDVESQVVANDGTLEFGHARPVSIG